MLPTNPSPQFAQSVLANLTYWHQKCAQGQPVVGRLNEDFSNLLRALQFGLALPATQTATAKLLLAGSNLVEANGQYTPWLSALKKALAVCDPADGELHYRLLDNIGQLYREQHDIATALEWHQRAAAVAATLPTPVSLGRVYFSLSHDYSVCHQLAPALQYAQQAQAIFAAHGTPGQKAVIHLQLGQIYEAQGDWAAAEAALRTSLGWWPPQYTHQIARTYTSLAVTLSAMGQRAEAEECVHTARAILEPTGSLIGLIELDTVYGTFLFETSRFAEAEACFRTVETRLRGLPASFNQAIAYNNLGNVLLQYRQLPAAEAYLREAAALHGQFQMALYQGGTLCTLGEVLARQGHQAEAVTTYDTGLALLARFPDEVSAQRQLRKYGQQRERVAAGLPLDTEAAPPP